MLLMLMLLSLIPRRLLGYVLTVALSLLSALLIM